MRGKCKNRIGQSWVPRAKLSRSGVAISVTTAKFGKKQGQNLLSPMAII